MYLSILTKQLRNETFARSIEIVRGIGYTHVCLGTGGVAHTEHDYCYAQKLVEDTARIAEYKAVLAANDVRIASFAMPANPVHPQKRIREKNDADLRATILLAEKFGVDTVTTMSGCPATTMERCIPTGSATAGRRIIAPYSNISGTTC